MPTTFVMPLLRNGDESRSITSRSASLSCRSGVMSRNRIPCLGKSGTSRISERRSTWLLRGRSVSDFKAAHRLLERRGGNLEPRHPSGRRTLPQLRHEGVDRLVGPGRHRLDAAVREIPHVADETEVARRPLGKVAISDALNEAPDQSPDRLHARSGGRGEWI